MKGTYTLKSAETRGALGWFEKVFVGGLVAIMAYIPFHALFSVSLGVLTGQPLLVKAGKEVVLLVLVAVGCVILFTHRAIAVEFVRSRMNQIAAAFVVLHMVLAVWLHSNLGATLGSLDIDIRFAVFFLAVRLAMQLTPRTRSYMLRAFIAGSVAVIVFGVLQQYVLPKDILSHVGYGRSTIEPYLTVDKNPNFIRINSTLRGPNPLGAYLVVVIMAVGACLVSRWSRLSRQTKAFGIVGILASLSVMYASYSRSAWIAVAVAAVVYAAVGLTRKKQLVIVTTAVVLTLTGVVGYELGKNSQFVRTVIDHKDPKNPSQSTSSNADHLKSIVQATGEALKRPLGAGIGSTGVSSYFGESKTNVENQYLFTTHEAGWLGLVLLVAFQGGVLAMLYRGRSDWFAKSLFASGLGLVFIGMTLPVFTDDTVAYVWWGLAAVGVAAVEVKKHAKRSQSAK